MAGGLNLERPPSLGCCVASGKGWKLARSRGGWAAGKPPPEWGLSTGTWPQFRTIQEKEVTVLNSKECEDFYHRFAKIPSLVRIINSQMICVQDTDRKHFCYVSACPCPALQALGQDGGGGRTGVGRE